MKKEFIINIVFLITINVIIKSFYIFGIDLKVQNEVDNYGLYFALLSFSYLFQIISDLGLYQYNNRKIAMHGYLFEKYFNHCVILKGFLSILFFGLSFLVAIALGYRNVALYLLSFILLNQILITYIFYFRSNISGLQYFKTDSIISVLDKIIMIIICVPMLWIFKIDNFRIEYFIYAQTFSFSFTLLVSLILNINLRKKRVPIKFSVPVLIVLLKKCAPFSLVVILMSLYTRVDIIMIERILYDETTFRGIKESNIYAAGYRLMDSFNMIILIFNGLLLPMFAKLIKEKGDFIDLFKLGFGIVLIITLSISLSFIFNSESIMSFLYLDYSKSMNDVSVLLMIGLNALGLAAITGTLLTANGSLKLMNFIFLGAIMINFISNLFLIPEYGAKGSAISTIFTQFFVFVAELLVAKNIFQFSYSFAYISRIISFIFFSMLFSNIINALNINWMYSFIMIGLTVATTGLVFKVVDYRNIFLLFNSNKS